MEDAGMGVCGRRSNPSPVGIRAVAGVVVGEAARGYTVDYVRGSMIGQRQQPFRSKALMAFVHEHLKPGPCAVCGQEPWTQLHHWGDDGGQGMKPSDHLLVRLCRDCATRYELKWKALVRDGKWALFHLFAADAFAILRAYVEHLEQRRGGTYVGGTAEKIW